MDRIPKVGGGLYPARPRRLQPPCRSKKISRLAFRRSVRPIDADGNRKTAVRYRGGSLKLLLRRRIAFGAAVIVVNYRSAVMSPVMPFEFPKSVVGPVPLVESMLEAVHRPIVLMITPTVAPIKFVDCRFVPFLKMAAAIPVTFAAASAPGP